MADGAKGAGPKATLAVTWERFFFYLNRFNAIVILLFLVAAIGMWLANLYELKEMEDRWASGGDSQGFGSDRANANSIIGQDVDTADGKIVAYYDSEDFERKENAGLVLVNVETSKTLPVAKAGSEMLVAFNFLYDQGDEDRPVVGYIARVATPADYQAGKSNLVVGALPAMTQHVVAESIMFLDLPKVRSDGHLGLVMWEDHDRGEVAAIDLSNGKIVDRATIHVPVIDPDRLSQGPGKADDPALMRREIADDESSLTFAP